MTVPDSIAGQSPPDAHREGAARAVVGSRRTIRRRAEAASGAAVVAGRFAVVAGRYAVVVMGARAARSCLSGLSGSGRGSMPPRMALRFARFLCLTLALAGTLAIGGAARSAAQLRLQTFERDVLVIETEDGSRHRFEVELALDNEQRAQGLMYRRDLADDAGLLFLYARVWPVSMWMRNTFIPLDMLFIAGDGRIVRIVERTVPQSLETISSGRPVNGVLEVNGGTVARLGIQPGDRVLHRAFDGGS